MNTSTIISEKSIDKIKTKIILTSKDEPQLELSDDKLNYYAEKFISSLLISNKVLCYLKTESNIITLENILDSCTFLSNSNNSKSYL